MLPFVLALQLNDTEQRLFALAFLIASALTGFGFLLYKIIHLVETTWPKVEGGVRRLIDFGFELVAQVMRRRAELQHLRNQFRAQSPHGSRRDALPSATV